MLEIIKRVKYDDKFYLKDDWLNLSLSNDVKKEIYNHLPFFRIESYFNYLYKLIYRYDFQSNGIKEINKEVLMKRYFEASKKILKEQFSTIIDERDEYCDIKTSFEWAIHYINYAKEAVAIKNTILDIINSSNEILSALGIDEKQNPYLSKSAHSFASIIITIGYSIASNRIISEINNNNLFGIEVVDYNNEQDLIIYLTPEGMLKASDLHKEMTKEERIKSFYDTISDLGIKSINNVEVKRKYDTTVLLEFNNQIYYHYTQFNFASNDFFHQKINRPHISSLLIETQANYRKVKD